MRTVVKANQDLFQLFFLKDDEKQSIEVLEADEIDFTELRKRIEHGESVFITRKTKQQLTKNIIPQKELTEICFCRV